MLLVFALAFPYLAGNDYHLTVMSTAYIFAIATVGLNLITGYTGQFNLAHSGFMAVGAYTVGILTVDHQVPFWIAFALSGVVAGVTRLVRRTGVAASEGPLLLDFYAVRRLHHVPADREMGKPHARDRRHHRHPGATGYRRRSLFGTPRPQYYLVLVFLVLGVWIMHRIVRLAARPHLHGDPQ